MEYKKIRFLILSKTNEIERMLDDLFIEGDILSDSQSIDQWLEGNALK